jgi:hypothetical protein
MDVQVRLLEQMHKTTLIQVVAVVKVLWPVYLYLG